MNNLNAVVLKGALWKEPELRYLPSGQPMLSFTVAGEQAGIKSDGQPVSSPFYQQVTLFGKQAETLATLEQGTIVIVEGRLDLREWVNKDEQKRSTLAVRASRVMVDGPGSDFAEDRGGGVRLKGGLNNVMASGTLGADAELRYTANGTAVASTRIAVDESWKDDQGAWQERTHWVKVTGWGDVAVKLANYGKGDRLVAIGRMEGQTWTDRDGNKRHDNVLVATTVEGAAKDANAAATRPAAQPTTTTRTSQPAAAATAAKAGAKRQGKTAVLDIDDGLIDDNFPPGGEELPF